METQDLKRLFGGLGAVRPKERGLRGDLGQQLDERENVHHGRPLPRRLRPEATTLDRYLAALNGPLPYMRRLRRIEDETEAHLTALADARAALAEEFSDEAAFARAWRRAAESWDFSALNELIEQHNAYYPIEARVPMDPRTGDYAKPFRRERVDAAWVLARFPA